MSRKQFTDTLNISSLVREDIINENTGKITKNTGVIRAIFPKCPYIRAYPYLYGRLLSNAYEPYAGYSLVKLWSVLQQMSRLAMVAPTNKTLLTVFRKFSSEKFLSVARLPVLASHSVKSLANPGKEN